MPRPLVSAVLFASLVACDRKKPPPPPTEGNPQEAPSAITIANVFGTCADAGGCADACSSGDAEMCRRLGTTYQFGTADTKKDETKAAGLYEKACGLKSAMGCVSAGQMFEFHHGVDKDDAKAASYYKQGCELGNQVGCANYAIMLENGRGVPKDTNAAMALYDGACQKGAGLACERLRALRAQNAQSDGAASDAPSR
jgi:TPR repeat protein